MGEFSGRLCVGDVGSVELYGMARSNVGRSRMAMALSIGGCRVRRAVCPGMSCVYVECAVGVGCDWHAESRGA